MKIFITGATGFLGYHIVCKCVLLGYSCLCLKRSTSTSLFSKEIEDKIEWIDNDNITWIEKIVKFKPDVLVHAAWDGVSSDNRNDRSIQERNIALTDILIKAFNYKKIIILGSQDEYGIINNLVTEDTILNPVTEYAKAKIKCCDHLKKYAEEKKLEWQWIRIFSVYGEYQREKWLIPSIIKKCLSGIDIIETTKGEQVYSYLYASDFADAIVSVIENERNNSGIYNLSSRNQTSISDLFLLIKELTGSHVEFLQNLPYRTNQSMMIVGDCQKFINIFGEYEKTSLREGIHRMIDFIKKNQK